MLIKGFERSFFFTSQVENFCHLSRKEDKVNIKCFGVTLCVSLLPAKPSLSFGILFCKPVLEWKKGRLELSEVVNCPSFYGCYKLISWKPQIKQLSPNSWGGPFGTYAGPATPTYPRSHQSSKKEFCNFKRWDLSFSCLSGTGFWVTVMAMYVCVHVKFQILQP